MKTTFRKDTCFFCGDGIKVGTLHQVSTRIGLQNKEVCWKFKWPRTAEEARWWWRYDYQGLYVLSNMLTIFPSKRGTAKLGNWKLDWKRKHSFWRVSVFRSHQNTALVFTMSKIFFFYVLCALYASRLKELGVSCNVHTTRLRQKLLAACPQLDECSSSGGKKITLIQTWHWNFCVGWMQGRKLLIALIALSKIFLELGIRKRHTMNRHHHNRSHLREMLQHLWLPSKRLETRFRIIWWRVPFCLRQIKMCRLVCPQTILNSRDDGKDQATTFIEERLVNRSKSIYDEIKNYKKTHQGWPFSKEKKNA